MPDLLIELFSEEIPARMQKRAGEDLKKLVTDGLVEAGLTYASAGAFTTPRRLALTVEELTAESKPVREERKGPRTDAPDQAIEGFLRSTGLSRDQLEARDMGKKGEVYFAVIERPGRSASDIVAEVLEGVIRNFPWPKSMKWGEGSMRWVRPLHRILCILTDEAGAQVVPLEVDGIKAADKTEGHRFLAPGAFSVASFEDYVAKLKQAHVVLDPQERADHIWADATSAAFAQGLEVVEDKGLLAEVAGLVEWPVVLMGSIDESFLGLPPEVLQTSMKEHQKFFSVKNPKTGRIEKFVTVANVETEDNGATILAGNQKVLFARLSDAKFFWENDLRVAKADAGNGMKPWLKKLSDVTYHRRLGTQASMIDRMASLSRELAPKLGTEPDQAQQAAWVAKVDLASEMVYEFPELQGIVGRYYLLKAGYYNEVANAARDHYAPLGPSDDVPTEALSISVALAEKLERLSGFWVIDEKPTGSKDPFALRRAALGVIRLLLHNEIRVSLVDTISSGIIGNLAIFANDKSLMYLSYFEVNDKTGELDVEEWSVFEKVVPDASSPEEAIQKLPRKELSKLLSASHLAWSSDVNTEDDNGSLNTFIEDEGLMFSVSDLSGNLLSFFHDRLKIFLKDQGIRHDVIDACIAMPGNDDLTLLVKRAEALSKVLKTEDGENLVQGFKRANNILSKEEEKDGVSYELDPKVELAETEEEKELFAALDAAEAKITPAMEAEEFGTAMEAMAALRAPIDAFFDAVKINADAEIVRRNRLCLLNRIRVICGGVADLTKLEG